MSELIKEEVKDRILKECSDCHEEKALKNFYKSSSIMFDGYSPMCKKCIKKMINYNDMNTIYNVFQTLDIVFVKDIWENCENKKEEKNKKGNHMMYLEIMLDR